MIGMGSYPLDAKLVADGKHALEMMLSQDAWAGTRFTRSLSSQQEHFEATQLVVADKEMVKQRSSLMFCCEKKEKPTRDDWTKEDEKEEPKLESKN